MQTLFDLLVKDKFLRLLVLGLCLSSFAQESDANETSGERIALVIGNNAYISEASLASPIPSAQAVAETLEDLGFKVLYYTDLSYFAMLDALEDFRRNLQRGGVGFFYYSGHGYNNKQDKWPTFALNDGYLWMTDVVRELKKKNPKLLMVVGECCNSYMDSDNLPSIRNNSLSSSNCKKLFRDFQGRKTILMSSSIQGQLSWSSLTKGSLHGICFRNAFYKFANSANANPSWNSILEETKRLTKIATNQKQKPQFVITFPSCSRC